MLSMKFRLDCPRSYATDDCPDLLCEMGGVCDGELYECCLWDLSLTRQMEVIGMYEKAKEGDKHEHG